MDLKVTVFLGATPKSLHARKVVSTLLFLSSMEL